MQAIDNETYLGWWGDVVTFDANNTGAEIRNREARRLVSTGQPLAETPARMRSGTAPQRPRTCAAENR